MSTTAPAVTAETLTDLRDTQQLSWAKVADALGLGSPGAARRAYSNLVRRHTESVLPGRTGSGSGLTPVDLVGATKATITDTIAGRTIVVQRAKGTEDIPVARVTSVKGGAVNFNDGDKSRTVKAAAIVAVR